jgi:hypothetical protein
MSLDCATDSALVTEHEMPSEMTLTRLMEFLAWLADQYEGAGFNLIEHHFDLSGYRSQLRGQISSGQLSESKALHHLLSAALSRVHKLSQVIVDNNVGAARIRRLYELPRKRNATCDNCSSDIDELAIRAAITDKHIEKWRALSGDSLLLMRQ